MPDSLTHQIKMRVNLTFFVDLDAGILSVATHIKQGFLSFGTFIVATWLQYRRTPFVHRTLFREDYIKSSPVLG